MVERGAAGMRLTDIGHQLKAFRLESGLKADEIATRLGISRAALYRYEKGEVIKLDTVQRLAELLQVSPLSLLGIGVEYYQRLPAYFERLKQMEEHADTILAIGGGASFLATPDVFEILAIERLRRDADGRRGVDPALRAASEATIESLEQRRAAFRRRQPNLVVLLALADVERLARSLRPAAFTADPAFGERCRAIATAEIARVGQMIENPPLGLQLGLMQPTEHVGAFRLLRQRDRVMLAINPFRSSGPLSQNGVAIVTGAAEAVTPHQRVAEGLWRHAIRGRDAATLLSDAFARVVAATD